MVLFEDSRIVHDLVVADDIDAGGVASDLGTISVAPDSEWQFWKDPYQLLNALFETVGSRVRCVYSDGSRENLDIPERRLKRCQWYGAEEAIRYFENRTDFARYPSLRYKIDELKPLLLSSYQRRRCDETIALTAASAAEELKDWYRTKDASVADSSMRLLVDRLDQEGYVLQVADGVSKLKVFVGGKPLLTATAGVEGFFSCSVEHYANNVVLDEREALMSGEDIIFQCRQAAGRIDLNFRLFGTGLRGLVRDLRKRGHDPEIWFEQPRARLRDVVGVPEGEIFVGPSIIVPELGLRVDQTAAGKQPVSYQLIRNSHVGRLTFKSISALRKELSRSVPTRNRIRRQLRAGRRKNK